jgi:hypothetical protein
MKLIKNILVVVLGVLAVIYLINPGAGIFELLPDNIPLVGNIDEGLATTILLAALRYYGLDVTRLLGRGQSQTNATAAR